MFLTRVAAFAFFIGLLSMSPAIHAQSKLVTIPAEEFAVAPGGVDMRTGRYAYDETDLTIGAGGGIALKRMMPNYAGAHANPFGNLSHNWDIMLLESRRDFISGGAVGNDFQMSAYFGGRALTFNSNQNSVGYAYQGSGPTAYLTFTGGTKASGTVVYSLRAPDGTILTFRPMGSLDCANQNWGSAPRRCAFVSEIVQPDGTKLVFDYAYNSGASGNRARLKSVTSSRGYALLLEGSGSLVSAACVLNLSQLALPASGLCPSSGAPKATYTYTGGGGSTLASVTDAGGATATFTYGTSGSQKLMGFVKPGETTPWLVNTISMRPDEEEIDQETIDSQAFATGESYSYSWGSAPFANNKPVPTIVGGSFTNATGATTHVTYGFPILPGTGPTTPCTHFPCPPRMPDDEDNSTYQQTPGPVEVRDPLDRSTTYDYCDPAAMAGLPPTQMERCIVLPLQSFTDAEGAKTELKYDGSTNLIQARRKAKPGGTLADILTSATYDCTYAVSCTKPASTTDAKGNVSNFTYSSTHGGVLTETRAAPTTGAARPQKRYTYQQFYAWYKNSAGTLVQSPYATWLVTEVSECRTGAAPACVGTADETRTTFNYGPTGVANNLLPVSTTVAAGDNSLSTTTSWTYDTLGNKLTEDGPLAGADDTTRWRYDAQRRVIGVITPDPDGAGTAYKFRATRNTYDVAGRLTKVEQGTVDSQSDTDWAAFATLVTTETAYDALDRKTRVWVSGPTSGTHTMTQYSYDLAGRLDCTAVRMNPAAFVSLPASACALGTQGTGANDFGPDRITRLTYNAAGEVTKTTLAYGTPLQTDQEANTYTPNGKLATVTDGENNRTTFTYDGHDRLSKTCYPVATVGALASSTSDCELLTFDANGNVIERQLRDTQKTYYAYDNLNRMTDKNIPNIVTGELDVTTTYDNLDRPILVADTASNNVGSTFDALGRMTAQTSPFGTIGMLYDEAGRLKRVTHPDGNYFTYEYNTADLTGIKENGTVSLATYGYDDLGLRKSIMRGNGTVKGYQYNEIGRLRRMREDLAGTTHDLFVEGTGSPNGNSMIYNPAGQIVSQVRTNDIYAWNGHFNVDRSYARNGLNQLTSAGATALSYDGRGNLTNSGTDAYTYTSENRLATGPGGAAVWYDPTGRISKLTKGGTTKKYEHLGPRLVIERDASNNIVNRYVHGPGDDEPVVWYIGSGLTTKRWLHSDERGSVIAISDASGLATAVNRYDEYGIPAATNVGTFQYTGQAWVPELGLYYYKARMYSPTLGRFMQADPIGYEDGINWYAYVANDPMNRSDPTGKQSVDDMQLQAQVADMRQQGMSEPQIQQEIGRQAGIQATALSMVIPAEGLVAKGLSWSTRVAAPVVSLMRSAEYFKPVAAGVSALVQRAGAVQSGIGRLAAGEGRVIAGAGSKDVFRGAEEAANKYGGNAADYAKVSVSEVTKSGDRVSVHAVRNVSTGEVFEKKVIYGR